MFAFYRKMKTFAERNYNAQPSVEDILRSLDDQDFQQLNIMTKDQVWNTPFLSNVPDYPISLEDPEKIEVFKETISAVNPSEEPNHASYAPGFFPRLPPLHSYKKSLNSKQHKTSSKLVQRSMLNLHRN